MGLFLLFLSLVGTANAIPMDNGEMADLLWQLNNKTEEVTGKDSKPLNDAIWEHIQKVNLYPDAIAVGVMGRCQHVAGFCAGTQVNIGKDKYGWKYSSYGMAGLSIGAAEIYKVEFFIALCYGDCLSSYAEGVFLSAETGATIIGGVSTFIEIGTDVSDLLGLNMKKPTLQSIWDYKTVYAGFGYNVGVGVGFSGTAYYYKHLSTKKLESIDSIKSISLF